MSGSGELARTSDKESVEGKEGDGNGGCPAGSQRSGSYRDPVRLGCRVPAQHAVSPGFQPQHGIKQMLVNACNLYMR